MARYIIYKDKRKVVTRGESAVQWCGVYVMFVMVRVCEMNQSGADGDEIYTQPTNARASLS